MPPVLDKIAFVSRLERNASNADKEGYITFSGFSGPGGIDTAAIRLNIQPASAELTVLYDGIVGKTFRAFTSVSGVVDGMKLTLSGTGEQYLVRGREVHDNGILPKHYQLVLTKDKR